MIIFNFLFFARKCFSQAIAASLSHNFLNCKLIQIDDLLNIYKAWNSRQIPFKLNSDKLLRGFMSGQDKDELTSLSFLEVHFNVYVSGGFFLIGSMARLFFMQNYCQICISQKKQKQWPDIHFSRFLDCCDDGCKSVTGELGHGQESRKSTTYLLNLYLTNTTGRYYNNYWW